MQIHMKKNAQVTVMNVCTPRKTPLAYLDAAKKKIDEDVKLGIIEKVDGISEWCSPMSFVQKPGGGVGGGVRDRQGQAGVGSVADTA